VLIEDSGHQRAAGEIHDARVCVTSGFHVFQSTHSENALALNGERLCARLSSVHGEDRATAENEIGRTCRGTLSLRPRSERE